jgi:hypothetical protein
MAIAYILFEKLPEDGRPPWTPASAHEFIKQRQRDPNGGLGHLIGLFEKSSQGFEAIVAKFECATSDRSPSDLTFRIVPVSRTVTYAVEDEPALDDFLEPLEWGVEEPEAFGHHLTPPLELIGDTDESAPPALKRTLSSDATPAAWADKCPIEQHADIIRDRLEKLGD